MVRQLLFGLEERPAERSDHHTAGNAQDRQSNAEEFEHIRADEQRTEQQEEAVDRDPKGKSTALPISAVGGQGEKDWSIADRINDREQTSVYQQKDMRKMVYHRTNISARELLRGAIGSNLAQRAQRRYKACAGP